MKKMIIILLVSAVTMLMTSCVVVDNGPGKSSSAPGQVKKSTGQHPSTTNPGKGSKK